MKGQNQAGRNRSAKAELGTFLVEGWQRITPSGERASLGQKTYKLIYKTGTEAMFAYAKEMGVPRERFYEVGDCPEVVIRVADLPNE
jgi:hypothetical protein